MVKGEGVFLCCKKKIKTQQREIVDEDAMCAHSPSTKKEKAIHEGIDLDSGKAINLFVLCFHLFLGDKKKTLYVL